MRKREDFHELLVDALGSRNVYFQPPEDIKLSYPCIKYSLEKPWISNADDKKYSGMSRYSIILIDYDPDSEEVVEKLNDFEYSSFDRSYAADNLNHFVFTIYY